MIKVRHLKVSRDGQINFSANEMHTQIAFRADVDAVKRVLASPNFWERMGLTYEFVAEVDTNSMDDAFERTNHIDRNWQDNRDVTARLGSHRSTSVGDLLELDGKTYMVDKIGFTEVEV